MLNNSLHSLQKRLLAIFLLVAFIFVAIILRLGYIQVIDGASLQERAAMQWSRSLPINATRGQILDAHGAVLATSYSTYDVYVRAGMVKNPNKVAVILQEYLQIDYETAYKKATDKSISESLIKMQVSNETANKIIKQNEPGILLSENSARHYPYGDLLTQVLGYTTIDNIGQAGIEAYANKYLTGVKGYATEQSDVNGIKIDNTLSNYIPSIDGLNVNLTIDVVIQQATEKALNQLVKDHSPKSATAIVMNPNTGEILAMSSKPSFNLNNVPRDNVQTLMEITKNLSIVDVYEPGSTFKVLTTASAIEQKVTTENDRFYDPGYRIVDGQRINCWKLTGHGSQTLVDGLCNSCNSVFVDLALRLGKDKMYEYFNKYGFGKTSNIDFLGESAGILMDKDSAKTVDIARMGFGQAIAVTPLQMITAISSVLNGGNLMQPYFIKSITEKNGKVIKQNTPTVVNRTVSEDTSKRVALMMEEVVKKANAFNAFIPGYRVSGKTGTSQKYENGKIVQKYYASFVGAFPADKPDYVVLVIADEPGSGHYYGSIVATPYAKIIFEDIIKYKNYAPHNLEEDLKLLEKNIEMPNLIGKSLTEAVGTLSKLGLQFEIAGEGGTVVNQLPPAGTMLYKNAIVLLEVTQT